MWRRRRNIPRCQDWPERRRNLSRGRDWAGLHPDLLKEVFAELPTFHVLGAVALVCRSWRNVTKEDPELWRRIDMVTNRLSSNRILMRYQTLVAINRSKGRLEEVAIDSFGNDELLMYLCDRTSVLKKLCLISCYEISEVAIAETAKRQPLLEEIQITYGSFHEEAIEIIGRECPQLKTFKFNHIWYSTPLVIEDVIVHLIGDEEALGIANTMHHLRHLQLIGNRMTNRGLRAILDGCPHLEILDIRRCRNVNMDADMRDYCARLKTIRLPEDSVNDYQFQADEDHLDEDHLDM